MNKSLAKPRFKRDYFTLYLYILSVVCGFHQAVLGSITPFLRDEFSLTKIAIGLHFSLYAIGMFLSGFLINIVSRKFNSKTILLTSSWGVAVAVAVFYFHLEVNYSLFMSFVLGLVGGAMQIAIQEALARHHGLNSGVAITEGCIFSAIGVFLGPICISLGVKYGLGWHFSLLVLVIAMIPLSFIFPKKEKAVHVVITQDNKSGATTSKKLPLVAYLMFCLIFLSIAAEWGIGFWGAQFLEVRLSVSVDMGVALMSVFFFGTILGRILVSRLLSYFKMHSILIFTIILSGLSILVLSLSSYLTISVIALALTGACLGNFFPLILSIATWQPPEFLSKISAGATQSVGLALLIAPLFLGKVGESLGLIRALELLTLIPPLMLIIYFWSCKITASYSLRNNA